jgi:hypothetical protein
MQSLQEVAVGNPRHYEVSPRSKALGHTYMSTILNSTFSCSFHKFALMVRFVFGYPAGWNANYMQTDAESGRGPERNDMQEAESKEEGGAPGKTRTPDPLLRRQLLYPPELQARGMIGL